VSTAVESRESTSRSKVHEARGFWRVLLAVLVPIPWLAKGIQYIVLDLKYDHSADQIRYDMAHSGYQYSTCSSSSSSSRRSSRWPSSPAGALPAYRRRQRS
jgi:hypothetical protein